MLGFATDTNACKGQQIFREHFEPARRVERFFDRGAIFLGTTRAPKGKLKFTVKGGEW